jgi:hypothetical protein
MKESELDIEILEKDQKPKKKFGVEGYKCENCGEISLDYDTYFFDTADKQKMIDKYQQQGLYRDK